MHTTLYFYTGTGNSLWAARILAEELIDAETLPLEAYPATENKDETTCLGLVFPVHIWGMPSAILRFLEKSATRMQPAYIFALAVNGGQVANTLMQLRTVLAGNGKTLAAGWEITMPSNYIPWGGPGPYEQQQKLFEAARRKIRAIAGHVKQQASLPMETGPLWQRLLLSGLAYPLSFRHIHQMDQKFRVDEKCNHCEICQKVCPAGNITLLDGKPIWNKKCEQCFACLQWCPQKAIQYGPKTPQYERYHHPEVTLKDVLRSRV